MSLNLALLYHLFASTQYFDFEFCVENCKNTKKKRTHIHGCDVCGFHIFITSHNKSSKPKCGHRIRRGRMPVSPLDQSALSPQFIVIQLKQLQTGDHSDKS